ncbi:MAG: adenine phosphoribosyltransferase [Candidatus Ancaeobacter aquaticus]|nr:adenine phosphoribosyltransferase [Candidatus Ancaeobacter aquaticus]
MVEILEQLRNSIREIPDFPKKGIIFKDITTLIDKGDLFGMAIDEMAAPYVGKGITKVVGVESRGFIFASAIAYKLGAGVVLVRKPGKLPHEIHKETYDLEYGQDTLEVHVDALNQDDKVILVDDLLATGGTVEATTKLIEHFGVAIEGIEFLIELTFLNGIKKLQGFNVRSLIQY